MSEVAQWFLDHSDIRLSQAVKVDKSVIDDPASGDGVFVDLSKTGAPNGDENTVEIMRIPHGITFDVRIMFQLLNDEHRYSSRAEFQRTGQKFKDVFARMLEYDGMIELLNESNTLIGFFLICVMLKDDYELPSVLVYYLDNVLLKTSIENGAKCAELLREYYDQYSVPRFLFDILKKFEQFVVNVPKETVRQVFAAVKSRCLEIPQELDQCGDDFVVNSTLVPVLDFCNHSSKPNAHFDVDRKTGDVLLLLDLDKIKDMECKKQEVFISYSPTVEILSFFNNYGFLPHPDKDDFQYINISIDRGYLSHEEVGNRDFRLFCKWLKINPVVQLIKYKGEWYINDTLDEFPLLLLAFLPFPGDFNKSCWHYDDRNYETFAHFHQFLHDNNFNDFSRCLKYYKRLISEQENQDCDIIGLPQLAWCFYYKDGDQLLKRRVEQFDALELAPFDDRKQFDLTIERFERFFLDYVDYRETRLVSYHGDNGPFNQFVNIELDILKHIKNDSKKNQLKFWSDVGIEAPETPQLALLTKPRDQDHHTDEDSGLDLEMLTIKPYNPRKLTDFYDQELVGFLQMMQK